MPKQVHRWIHALVASIIISVPLTLVMIGVNVGFVPEFWEIYVSSLCIAIAVATPVSLFAAPAATRFLRIFDSQGQAHTPQLPVDQGPEPGSTREAE